MAKALFISPAELKIKTVIDGNVDDDKLTQFIEIAQDMHVHDLLGSTLYRHLQSLITGGTINDAGNAVFLTLITDYIKPVLVHFSMVEFLPWCAVEISNGGAFKGSSEQGETLSMEDIGKLLNKSRTNAEFFTRRLIDFLCDNDEDYPQYDNQTNNSDMDPNKNSGSVGWVL